MARLQAQRLLHTLQKHIPTRFSAKSRRRVYAPDDEDADLDLIKPGGQRPGIKRRPVGSVANVVSAEDGRTHDQQDEVRHQDSMSFPSNHRSATIAHLFSSKHFIYRLYGLHRREVNDCCVYRAADKFSNCDAINKFHDTTCGIL